MAKYKVGDKVQIVSLDKFQDCIYRNHDGEMDHWCDQIMTVRMVMNDYEYYMEEDKDERCFGVTGWVWDDSMIAGLASGYNIGDINKDDLLSFITT